MATEMQGAFGAVVGGEIDGTEALALRQRLGEAIIRFMGVALPRFDVAEDRQRGDGLDGIVGRRERQAHLNFGLIELVLGELDARQSAVHGGAAIHVIGRNLIGQSEGVEQVLFGLVECAARFGDEAKVDIQEDQVFFEVAGAGE